jgi:diguanylate cyclase (GGDEF)-like protein
MKKYLAICVDDDEEFLGSLKRSLPGRVTPLCQEFAVEFEFVTSPQEVQSLVVEMAEQEASLAMLISDQLMPGINGLDLIEQIKTKQPGIACVLLTGHAGLEQAKRAINQRLLDQYVTKPIEDMEAFAASVSNLLKRHHLSLEERQRTGQLAETVEQLRASNEKIRAMHAAAEQIAMLSKGLKCVDLDEVVRLVTEEVPKLFEAEFGVLCMKDAHSGPASQSAMISRNHCPVDDAFLVSRPQAEEFQGSQAPFLLDHVPHPCEALNGRPPGVVIPLQVSEFDGEGHEQRYAYMCLCRANGTPPMSQDLFLYKAGLIREVLSANLTNAVLYRIALMQSEVDSLTGTYTRRVLEDRLQTEFNRAARYGRPFCITVVDVDDFKHVNDQFGHAAGDQVLRDLADIMQQEMRNTDTLARYGGDEFVWILPETDSRAAAMAMERLRTRVASQPASDHPAITVSCGVAEWTGATTDTASDVLRRADAAMYQAKRTGRNRVEVHSKQTGGPYSVRFDDVHDNAVSQTDDEA